MKIHKFAPILFGCTCILLIWYAVHTEVEEIPIAVVRPSFIVVIDEYIDSANIENDDSIFFIETRLEREHSIDSHQACSIESAGETMHLLYIHDFQCHDFLAIMYPERNIYVMFVTTTNDVQLNYSKLPEAILNYKNVHFKYLNMHEFSKNTPLEAWLLTDKLEKSRFKISHTSDALRFLTLWKFGGTYLDLDVIVTKPTDLRNFACAESQKFLNAAVLDLDNEVGKEFASTLIQ